MTLTYPIEEKMDILVVKRAKTLPTCCFVRSSLIRAETDWEEAQICSLLRNWLSLIFFVRTVQQREPIQGLIFQHQNHNLFQQRPCTTKELSTLVIKSSSRAAAWHGGGPRSALFEACFFCGTIFRASILKGSVTIMWST
jgi:hypothetical protein